MKKTDCIAFFVDNYLYLRIIKNNKDYKLRYDNYLFWGRIVKPNILIKKISEILKKEKVLKLLSTLSVIAIYNPQLKYIDKKVIINTLEDSGFKDIKLYNTLELIQRSKPYLEINNNYMIYYYNHKYEFIPFNKYNKKEDIIKDILNGLNKDIYLIGISQDIIDLSEIHPNLYYYNNYECYYLNKFKKN